MLLLTVCCLAPPLLPAYELVPAGPAAFLLPMRELSLCDWKGRSRFCEGCLKVGLEEGPYPSLRRERDREM